MAGVNLPVINKDVWVAASGGSGCVLVLLLMLVHVYPQPQAVPSLHRSSHASPSPLQACSSGWQRALTLILSRGESSIFLSSQSPLLYLSLFLFLAPGTNKYLFSLLIKQKEEEHKGKLTTNHPRAEHARVHTHTRTHKKRLDACDLRGPLHAGSGCTSKLFINKSS